MSMCNFNFVNISIKTGATISCANVQCASFLYSMQRSALVNYEQDPLPFQNYACQTRKCTKVTKVAMPEVFSLICMT